MSSSAANSPRGLDAGEQALLDDLVEVLERPRLDVDESEMLDQPSRLKRSTLPEGRIPTFGEPEDKCGELVPEAMFWCPCCYDVKEFPHNCYRYDCPMHGLHAVRRRAGGQRPGLEDAMPGIAAKLGALRGMLDVRRDTSQVYQHFQLSPPSDFFWRSNQPLERGFQLAREFMDVFGAQGLVAYHPYRSKEDDDRGFWKTIIGQGLDWQDAREQLIPYGHFHFVVVADKGGIPGGDVTRALEAETGWILDRFSPRESNVSVYGDEELARAVTYTLSHSMVYDTAQQRRLAARLKGPDINDAEVYADWWREHQANVYEAAETTLGIPSPSMECDRELTTTSTSISLSPARDSGGGSSSASRSTDLPNHSNADATGEVLVGSNGPVDASTSMPDTPGTSTSTETERCGGELRHISTAGDVLPELIDGDVDVSDLDDAYRSYVDVMRARGLSEDVDGRAEIPEFGDRPPPD